MPPPLSPPYFVARLNACAGSSGSTCAPESAAASAVPRADVERHRDGAEQRSHEDGGDDDRLACVVVQPADHSRRSFIVLVRVPDLTTHPSRSIWYGYEAVTVTSLPDFVQSVAVTATASLVWSRSDAALRTACTAS